MGWFTSLNLVVSFLFFIPLCLASKVPTQPINDVSDQRKSILALTHATIHLDETTVLEDATLVIEGERIISIDKNNKPLNNAITKDLSELHIYPGFILMDSDIGIPKPPKETPFRWGKKETIQSTKHGAFNSNEAIKASTQAATHYNIDTKANKTLRNLGFTTALVHQHDGVMRGTSALVNLRDDDEQKAIIQPTVSQHFSFNKGSSKQDYPVSLMGHAALIRQTLLDAQWYKKQNDMIDLDLAAINENSQLPNIIEVSNWHEILLANKIGKEFNKRFIVKTAGDSYQSIDAIAQSKQSLIVPLKKEKAPSLNNELDLFNIDYKDLKAWELTPYNPGLLADQGITFALIPDQQDSKSFLNDLRTAVKHGLSEEKALASITSIPAKMISNNEIGQIKEGAFANLVITTGNLFEENSEIAETWVAGQAHTVNGLPLLTNGEYQLTVNNENHDILIQSKAGKLIVKAAHNSDQTKYKVKQDYQFITIEMIQSTDQEESKDHIDKNGTTQQTLTGYVIDKQVKPLTSDWSLTYIRPSKTETEETNELSERPDIPFPFSAYGLITPPNYPNILIQNVTIWTNESEGIIENSDVLVTDGKIVAIGNDLKAPKHTHVINGAGMHLTSGIIDEHSHIALLSVNDVAVNSAMVRMEDAINSHDINIYRNLAGGVTAAQLLHGSANPIGGQSALVKYKWGVDADEMLIDGADRFIKFALGENVKRSSSKESIRYPLTRMGVEQIYRDQFTQAKSYQQAWNSYNKLSSSQKKKTSPPRRDLAMDIVLEILNKDRFVSCHSYVQSEINMLMKVADDFDFNINTFTHILEGYKVADKMYQHGVGGSTFSDWWAYKWEVNYAIPYNASLMHKAGVVTAINSDSAEMSRRLNQEAAKSIKYGGMSEQDAWKMVTLNPAKLLHLDDRMGSVKPGKDADLVLWSDNPLSIYAQVNKTMVDGVIYYDRDQQPILEKHIANAKKALVTKVKDHKGPKKPFRSAPEKIMHCDTLTASEHNKYHQLSGGGYDE